MKRRIAISTLIILGAFGCVFGQKSTQQTENKADQVLRSNGRVNPSTLGMEMDIPLGGYPGRGISLPVSLNYSSKLWRLQQFKKRGLGGDLACNAYTFPVYAESSAAGWTTSVARPQIEYTGQDGKLDSFGNPLPRNVICGASGTTNINGSYIRRLQIQLPSGGSHELRAEDAPHTWDRSSFCGPGQTFCDPNDPSIESNWYGTYYAVDGSGYKYVETATSARLWLQDGSYYDFGGREGRSSFYLDTLQVRKATTYADRNGNVISYRSDNATAYPNGYWRDTIGRDIPVPLALGVPSGETIQNYSLPGLNGNLLYRLNWKLLQNALTDPSQPLRYAGDKMDTGNGLAAISPSLFQSGNESGGAVYILSSVGGAVLFNPVVLREIELPNGQKYKFTYNVYGEIDGIQYPAGGKEAFTYNQVEPLGDTEGTYKQTNRGVTNRRVYGETLDTVPLSTWIYGVNANPLNYNDPYSVYTVAPDNTRSERFLYRSPQNLIESHGTWDTTGYWRG